MRTLVLNAGFEPIHLVSWQKALCLVISSKAEIVAEYDEVVRSVSHMFKLPSVVRLKRYVRSFQRVMSVRCTRKNILLRDRGQCQYCGVFCSSNSITIDHINPKSKGGKTTWDNVVAACPTCNRKKGDKSIERCGMKLIKAPKRPTWLELFAEFHREEFDYWRGFLANSA